MAVDVCDEVVWWCVEKKGRLEGGGLLVNKPLKVGVLRDFKPSQTRGVGLKGGTPSPG